jgi:hypothetical protein
MSSSHNHNGDLESRESEGEEGSSLNILSCGDQRVLIHVEFCQYWTDPYFKPTLIPFLLATVKESLAAGCNHQPADG